MTRTFPIVPTLAAIMLAGCANAPLPFTAVTPQLDQRFGESVRRARAAQTLDPGATQRNAGVTTMTDGRTAAQSVDLYIESFKAPPQTFSIFGTPVSGGR
ncbi:MAG: hypothetical protein ABIU95_06185 [Burkholderiales bacterium]